MAGRTLWSNRLVDWEILEQIQALPNSGENEALAKVDWDIVNKTIQWGWGWEWTVTSVNNVDPDTQGNVSLDTDDIPEGTTNQYFTDTRVENNSAVQANTAKVGITQQQADDITANNAKRSYPQADETKLAGIETWAQVNTLNSVVAGAGINIDVTDPLNPIISGDGVDRWPYFETLSADSTTVTVDFDLPDAEVDILIFLNGAYQNPNQYTRTSARVITFDTTVRQNTAVTVATLSAGTGDALMSQLSPNAIPIRGINGLEDSGMRKLSNGEIFVPWTPEFEGWSLQLWDVSQISETNSFLTINNMQFPDTAFDLVDGRRRRTTESERPRQFFLTEAENSFTLQSDTSTVITANPLIFDYTATLDAQTNSLSFNVNSEMVNVRWIVRYNTGNRTIIRHFPSKDSWLSGTGWLTLAAGTQSIDLWLSPFRTFVGDEIEVEIRADNISLLWNSSNFPMISAMVQRGEFRDIAYLSDMGSGWELEAANVSVDDTNLTGIITWSGNVQEALKRIDNTWLWATPRTFTGSFRASYWEFWNQDTWYGWRQTVEVIGARIQPNGRYTFELPDTTELNSMFDDLASRGLGEIFTITIGYLWGSSSSITRNSMTVVAPSISALFNRNEIPVTFAQWAQVTFRIERVGGNIGTWSRVWNVQQATDPVATVWEVVLRSTVWNNQNGSFLPPASSVLQGYAFPVRGSTPNDGTLRQGLLDAGVSDRVIYDGDYVIWSAPTFTSWSNWDDWFVLSRNDLQRMTREQSNFLAQTTEIDNRVEMWPINALGAEWVVWISENPLAEAPFINPSTDTNNPRTWDDYRYIGWRENRDFTGLNFQFGQNRFNSYLTVGITPSFATSHQESDIFINIRDENRNLVTQLNLADDFTFVDDATFTNSTYRHYQRNTTVNYPFLATIEVVLTQVQEHFRLDANTVDVTENIADGWVTEQKLSSQVQDKLNRALPSTPMDFSSIEDRLSPYKTVSNVDSAHDALFLSTTATAAYPQTISSFNAVSSTNPRFPTTDVVLFVAVPSGWSFLLKNITADTSVPLMNGMPNIEVVESISANSITYFVYRVTSVTSGDVYEVDRATVHQVVAWADDIRNLEDDIERIDTELKHAALNLPDDVVQVLENDVTVIEESNPTITSSDYNNSLWNTGNQTVFYETNPNTPSAGTINSKPISDTAGTDRARRKLIYFPENINYVNQAYVTAFDGTTGRDLIVYQGGKFFASVRVNGRSASTSTETIYPAPPTRVSGANIWQTIPALTFINGVPTAEADELFFTRNVPSTATTLTIQYRGHANGNVFGENTITLANVWGPQDAFGSFTLNDGSEQLNVEVRYDAASRRIRVSETARVFTWLPTINDVQVILSYSETRTIPAVSWYNKLVELENEHTGDQVFAMKPSSNGNVIIVGDRIEIDTNRPYTTLFGATESGFLTAMDAWATFLDYEDFDPIDTTVTSLENHATLPQFGLFTTNYTHETTVDLDTSLAIAWPVTPWRLTTTQRDALTAVDWMIIYNTTNNRFEFRENGAWVTK